MVSRTYAGAIALPLLFAAGAPAQTFNSFRLVEQMQGVTIEQLGPLEYRVSLSATPTLTIEGTTLPITDLFGFWALSEDDDIVGSTSDFGVWNAHSNNASTGGILGWRTNPNTGVVLSQSEVFTFDALNTAGVEFFGFHVRLAGTFPGTSGNTGFVYLPAPGPAAAFALAGLIAARRRRR